MGQLGPEDVRSLWPGGVAVGATHFVLALRVIEGLRANEPLLLADIASASTPPVLPMRGAIARHLQQLPDEKSGLSLTEELSLKALEAGPKTAGELFRQMMLQDEPLPYLGDLMYWFELKLLVGGSANDADRGAEDWAVREVMVTDGGRRAS